MLFPALPDPEDLTAAASWVLSRFRADGIDIIIDADMDTPVLTCSQSRRIWLPRSQSFPISHFWALRARLFLEGGAAWAPEFGGRPNNGGTPLRLVA
jgi:hypothetical protein